MLLKVTNGGYVKDIEIFFSWREREREREKTF